MRALVSAVAAGLVLVTGLAAALSPAGATKPGDWVVEAQQQLRRLGCSPGPADGHVTTRTRSAVVRFQSRSGLGRTGHLDAPTRQRLRADDAPRCDQRPVPGSSGSGRRIVVSQEQNWVWLVGPRGGVVAQGGMVDNPSVLHRGSYAVGSYCGRAARIQLNRSSVGNLWLDNFVRFAPCGIGFHRIPRSMATGRQIHPDWILGTDMSTSHGCVRLSNRLSEQVWDFTARRTAVRVV